MAAGRICEGWEVMEITLGNDDDAGGELQSELRVGSGGERVSAPHWLRSRPPQIAS